MHVVKATIGATRHAACRTRRDVDLIILLLPCQRTFTGCVATRREPSVRLPRAAREGCARILAEMWNCQYPNKTHEKYHPELLSRGPSRAAEIRVWAAKRR